MIVRINTLEYHPRYLCNTWSSNKRNFQKIFNKCSYIWLSPESFFVLKQNFAYTWKKKVYQRYSKVKATSIWHLRRCVNELLWKAAWLEARFFSNNKWCLSFSTSRYDNKSSSLRLSFSTSRYDNKSSSLQTSLLYK